LLGGVTVDGFVRGALGADPALSLSCFATLNTANDLAFAIANLFDGVVPGPNAFVLNTKITADGRIIVLPPIPQFEERAFLLLSLDPDAPFALDAASALLLGNVAPATHGETIPNEVVGDGDAAQAFQRFALKKKPVTFVPSAVPGGIASSLQIAVNGVKWREVASLYGTAPSDQVYLTRVADDGRCRCNSATARPAPVPRPGGRTSSQPTGRESGSRAALAPAS